MLSEHWIMITNVDNQNVIFYTLKMISLYIFILCEMDLCVYQKLRNELSLLDKLKYCNVIVWKRFVCELKTKRLIDYILWSIINARTYLNILSWP